MPRTIVINPAEVRKEGILKSKDIILNKYKSDFKLESEKYGTETLKQVLTDMLLIRQFESSLNDIKIEGSYKGIKYNHRGPAHLSMGQEAAAVGQSLNLTKNDFVFGSHRSHGEILGKCLSVVHKLSDSELEQTMKSYMNGRILKVLEHSQNKSVNELAIQFVLYGTMSEIFAKETGFNMGMGSSMHAFFAPFGSMPNNAIVGGSSGIAVGAALYKRINHKPGIVISNVGDGASATGPTWEAMMLAAMDQYTKLWDKNVGGAPPVIFNFMNNFYGMGGQTFGETMGFGVLARIGAGINPDAMHSERVDGSNPLAVADAIDRKRKILEKGSGPVLLDTITYRFSGHSPSDASSYRTKEELNMWLNQDPINEYGNYLISNKVISSDEFECMQNEAVESIKNILNLAISDEISPRISFQSEIIGELMFSNKKIEKFDDRKPEVLISKEENPRVKSLLKKERYGIDENGKPFSKAKVYSLRDGLFEAILHRAYIDPTLVIYGEENRDWGGAFAAYRGLTEALPYHRLFNTPISEASIVGSAVGYAMCGGRVLAELMYCDFLGRAGDEVFNQMSKWQAMSAGILKMPFVLRISIGSKYGAQHSQDWTSMVAHVPGLKVMFPVTPYDAKGMLNLALSGSDPVLFFESQRLYDIGEMFVKDGVPGGYYEIEEGEPAIRRTGKDLTIVTIGSALYSAMQAADILEKEYKLTTEIIDARFINPLNYDKIIESVKKTGKVLLVSEAVERGSFLNTIAAQLTQLVFDYLDAPPVVLGARNWITPGAELEEMFFPQKEWLIDAIHERICPLPGYKTTTLQTLGEMQRRNRKGI
ncbi:MAG: thiamine pyrophosphate-dependent enzyme [Ignavibacteriaceae bacterium]